MRIPWSLFLISAVGFSAVLSTSSNASTPSGIDTPTGVTSLTFAVQGVAGCTLTGGSDALGNPTMPNFTCNGNVGIGTSSVKGATLQIDGLTNSYTALYLEATGTGNIPQYLQFGKNGTKQWNMAGGGLDNNLYIQNIPDASSNVVDNGNVMTITPGGYVGIDTTEPGDMLDVNGGGSFKDIQTSTMTVQNSVNIGFAGNAGDGLNVYVNTNFGHPNALVNTNFYGPTNVNSGTFNVYGDAAVSGNFWVSGTQVASDVRLKTEVQEVTGGLDIVMALKPVTFLWKQGIRNTALLTDPTQEAKNYGFIAQDIEKVLPDLVKPMPQELIRAQTFKKPEDGFLTVNYEGIIAPLVKAVQEQQAEINKQQAEIEALKADRAAKE